MNADAPARTRDTATAPSLVFTTHLSISPALSAESRALLLSLGVLRTALALSVADEVSCRARTTQCSWCRRHHSPQALARDFGSPASPARRRTIKRTKNWS